MFKVFEYKEIDKNKINGTSILIDVRSPKEYKSSTIPKAINIPIFNDKERKLIGTIYTQDSVETAKKLGIKAAANKLPDIYNKVTKLDKQYNNLIFFCARGGFRSSQKNTICSSLWKYWNWKN